MYVSLYVNPGQTRPYKTIQVLPKTGKTRQYQIIPNETRPAYRQTYIHTYGTTNKQRDILDGRLTGTDSQTARQTNIRAERQTDKHTTNAYTEEIETYIQTNIHTERQTT